MQRDIGLEAEACLAGAALQAQRRIAAAVPELRLLRPGAGEIAHVVDGLVNAEPEAQRRRDVHIGPAAAIAYHRAAAQQAGGRVDGEVDIRDERQRDGDELEPQRQRIGLIPRAHLPGHRLFLAAGDDHRGIGGGAAGALHLAALAILRIARRRSSRR